MVCAIDIHIVTLTSIMFASGAFGGYLNYLHSFDVSDETPNLNNNINNKPWLKYTLLGIGAAFLVPAFLQMIASTLTDCKKHTDYLIFSGFCLIASIFSRRFVTTIGEKILEAAKEAKQAAMESKNTAEKARIEAISTKQQINDTKLAVDLANIDSTNLSQFQENTQDGNKTESAIQELTQLANSYIERTSVPEYSERLRLKSDIGRKMGEIIIRNKLNKTNLLNSSNQEGMLLALASSIQLRPDDQSLPILINISKQARQLYTKYCILSAFETLARINLIPPTEVPNIRTIVSGFQQGADLPLLQKIQDSLRILNIVIHTTSYTQ